MKFTKDPWKVGECQQVLTNDGRTVADAGCSIFPKEEREANANLIAAAPELYDALLRMKRYLGSIRLYIAEEKHSIRMVQQVEYLFNKVNFALKKADGKEDEK